MKIPQLAKKPEKKSCHGIEWEDNYSWIHQKNILEVLKDGSKLIPEVRDYLEKENAYTEFHLKDTKLIQKKLFDEIKGRIKLDDESLPFKDVKYFYWTKTTEKGNYSIKLRKKIGSENIEEIWNGDKEKEKLKTEYFGVGDLEVSNNDKYLGYSLDLKGSEYYTIYLRDIKTNKIISKEKMRKLKPKYLLVLIWSFRKEVIIQEKKFILNGGICKIGVESTIISIINKPRLLRYGGLGVSKIKKTLRKNIIININSKDKISPGLFPLHYSPGLPLRMNAKKNKTNEAFVLLKKRENVSKDIYYLSKTNNLNEAAKNLYSVLRKIKKDKYKSIAVEKIPNEGIGKTINDRLKSCLLYTSPSQRDRTRSRMPSSA